MRDNITFAPAGDQGILIHFADEISEDINRRIRGVMEQIEHTNIKGVTEVIPSYTSLLVLYDRHLTSFAKLERKLNSLLKNASGAVQKTKKIFEIPVCYEGRFALDLVDVAEHSGLDPEAVIAIHSGRDYLIYMLGFLPGFVYLGGMDERIACPRLATPRTKIPAGGVGIGGKQTGIYPLESPGGWRILGQTPLKVYDPRRDPSILYEMGDYIRFVPISSAEYERIEKEVADGTYRIVVREEEL